MNCTFLMGRITGCRHCNSIRSHSDLVKKVHQGPGSSHEENRKASPQFIPRCLIERRGSWIENRESRVENQESRAENGERRKKICEWVVGNEEWSGPKNGHCGEMRQNGGKKTFYKRISLGRTYLNMYRLQETFRYVLTIEAYEIGCVLGHQRISYCQLQTHKKISS